MKLEIVLLIVKVIVAIVIVAVLSSQIHRIWWVLLGALFYVGIEVGYSLYQLKTKLEEESENYKDKS